MDDSHASDDDFQIIDESRPPRELAMFPLPNVVLFPNMVLPLHIFEERYKLMVNDCLEQNRLLGMVLMKKGWENAPGDPEPYDVACMGRITKAVKLINGNMNILLNGLLPVRIDDYVKLKPYRIASITPLYHQPEFDEESEKIGHECRENFFRILSLRNIDTDNFQHLKLLDSPRDIINFLGAHLQTDYHTKQVILECDDLGEQVRKLARIMNSYLGMLN